MFGLAILLEFEGFVFFFLEHWKPLGPFGRLGHESNQEQEILVAQSHPSLFAYEFEKRNT